MGGNVSRESEDSEMVKIKKSSFLCPVCLEIPDAKVFLCSNGHSICNTCLKKVVSCPQCRNPMRFKVRNLAMESAIAEIVVHCKNKARGCNEFLAKKALSDHLQTCKYGLAAINICKILGVSDCTFKSRVADDVHSHLLCHHQLPNLIAPNLKQGDRIEISLEFVDCLKEISVSKKNLNFYGLIELDCEDERKIKLCVFICFCVEKQEVSISCVHFCENEELPFDDVVTLQITTDGKGERWMTSFFPGHYTNLKTILKNAPFKSTLSRLVDLLGDGFEGIHGIVEYYRC